MRLNDIAHIKIKIVAQLLFLQTRKWKSNSLLSTWTFKEFSGGSFSWCIEKTKNIRCSVLLYLRYMLLFGSEPGTAKKAGKTSSCSLCLLSSNSPFLYFSPLSSVGGSSKPKDAAFTSKLFEVKAFTTDMEQIWSNHTQTKRNVKVVGKEGGIGVV